MIDCKIAKNYFEEKARMVYLGENGCNADCLDCPLSAYNNGHRNGCKTFESMYPDEAIAAVQKWSDEHPQKTFWDDFTEKMKTIFPEVEFTPYSICREKFYCKSETDCCSHSCEECWEEPMK